MIPLALSLTLISSNCSEGGNIDAKISVTLACKWIFVSIFISEEPPMLLVWPQAMQEDVPLNSYNFSIFLYEIIFKFFKITAFSFRAIVILYIFLWDF